MYIGGKIGIDVVPDTRDFHDKLRDFLLREESRLEAHINIDGDTTGIREDLRRYTGKQGKATVDVDADTSKLSKRLEELRDKKPSEIVAKITTDRQSFERAKREIDAVNASHRDLIKSLTKSDAPIKRYDRDLSKIAKSSLNVANTQKTATRTFAGFNEKMSQQHDRVGNLLADYATLHDRFDQMEKSLIRLDKTGSTLNLIRDTNAFKKQLREQIEALKTNPNHRISIDEKHALDLDLHMHKAEEKLKKFKRDNDELKMDLDLETLSARAHLAAFTRPRTINIHAVLKDTDFGKIVDSAFGGSTGLRGFERRFSQYADLLNNLDTFIPKITAAATIMNAMAAGGTNLARSLMAVGTSAVVMSRSVLLAPAALSSLAAAAGVAKYSVDYLKDSFDSAKAGYKGFDKELGKAAWDEYADTMYRIARESAPSVQASLKGIAEAEGKLVEQTMLMVEQAHKTGDLSEIFDNTRISVMSLSPAVASATRALLSLSADGSNVLIQMAQYANGAASRFQAWAQSANETNKVQQALHEAAVQGGYLKDIIFDLAGILAGLAKPLADGENGLQGFSEATAKVREAVESVKFQETLATWVEGAQAAQREVRGSFTNWGDALYQLRDTTSLALLESGKIVAAWSTASSRALQDSEGGIHSFVSSTSSALQRFAGALEKSGPLLSDLMESAGVVADTFAGTFSAGLSAATPLLRSVAKTSQMVAEAFDKLPEPVKAAVALWLTFGKSAVSAFSNVKMGMMQNIVQTAEYKAALAQLGVQANATKLSLIQLAQVRFNQATGVDVFTNIGSGAKKAARDIETVAVSATGVTGAMGRVKAAGAGLLATTKNVAGGIVGMFGGPVGVAVTAGVGVLTVAYSDYARKAQATEQANHAIANSLNAIPNAAQAATNAINKTSESIAQISNNFQNPDFAETGLNWLSDWTTGFNSAADAASTTGISVKKLAMAATNVGGSYRKVNDELEKQIANGTISTLSYYGQSVAMDKTAKAASKQSEALKEARKQYIENAEATAEANGHSKQFADGLIKMGLSADTVASKLRKTTDISKDYARAMDQLSQSQSNAHKANIRSRQSETRYAESLADMKNRIEEIKNLGVENVWDQQASSINTMSEAGRKASDALTSLASSGADYIDSMIASGKPLDEILAKQTELSSSFVQTARDMGIPKEAAEELARQYLSTPTEIKTRFEAQILANKNDIINWLDLVKATFPDKKTDQMYSALVKATMAGDITSIEQAWQIIQELEQNNGEHKLTIDANGEAVLSTTEEVNNKLSELANKRYTVNLFTAGNAEHTMPQVIQFLKDLGVQDKKLEWYLDAQVPIEEKGKSVKKLLNELNLDDKTIEYIIKALDQASEPAGNVQEKMRQLRATSVEPMSLIIRGTEAQKNIQMVNLAFDNMMFRTQQPAILSADNTPIIGTIGVTNEAVNTIPSSHLTTLNADGNTTPFANAATFAVNAVPNGKDTVLNGYGNTAQQANAARDAVNSVPTSKNSTLTANVQGLGLVQSLKNVWDSITSKTVSIWTHITEGHATGGRIEGAGTWTSDSIPAMLSNGEAVLRAQSLYKVDSTYGKQFFDTLNLTGDVKKALSTSPAGRNLMGSKPSVGNIQTYAISNSANGARPITQNFDIKVVRSSQDLYSASSIMYRNATREARML